MEKSSVYELLTPLGITTLSKIFFSSVYVRCYCDIICYAPVTYNCEENWFFYFVHIQFKCNASIIINLKKK